MKLYMFIQMLVLLLLFCCVGNVCCSTVPNNSTDVVALLEFKQAITNRPAEALSNWNRSTNICQWQGVTCNPKNQGRVTALNLAGLGLSGAIAASVGNLTFLHTLNLSTNRFSGQIPPLGNLHKLHVLDLSTNSLEGNIPDTITNCSSLRILWLFSNSLVGIIPPEIGHLFNLVNFDLSVNNLTGIIPSSIQNITGLTELSLGTNQLSGIIPDGLGRNLGVLSLGSNLLGGVIPDTLTNCSNLTILELSRNNLTGIIPPGIGSLTKLTYLFFQRNGLSGGIPAGLGNLVNLSVLYLSENQLNGPIPSELWQMPNIMVLDLNSNNLSGGIPQKLSNLPYLQQLSLAVNMLGNTLPSNIGDALPSITTLYLGMNMFEGPIPASLGNASGLAKLDLSYNKFSGQIPSIFSKLSGLSILNLDHNMFEASDRAGWEFFQGLTNCRSLEVLSMSDNHLQGFIPNSVANLSTNLTKLVMGGNYLSGIVPPGIGNLSSLSELALDGNNLTGTIEEWIGELTKLHSLYLQGNSFTGTVPPSIINLAQLTVLSLAQNKFTGPIPPSLGNQLQLLSKLNLSYNNFRGIIPGEFGNLQQLVELDLSSNKLSGEIPETLGQCQQLVTIQMGQNVLTGNIPTTFSKLYSLNILNVSHNNFSGPLPAFLDNLKLLKLDLSYNSFQGEIPRNSVFDNATVVSLEGNPGLCGGDMDLKMPSCSRASRRTRTVNYLIKILIPIFGFLSLVLLVYFLLVEKKTSRRAYLSQDSFGEHFAKVTYKDLAQSTRDFSEVNLIGRGSYGSVYRGKLKESKMEVAVKVFNLQMPGAERSFLSECQALRSIQHRNLLPILTACSTVDNAGNVFKALIYEFMPNGSLDTWLYCKGKKEGIKFLSLSLRIGIIVNVADALDYLHHDCGRPTVHCDLKPSNILLDDDMNALLGDFGIARLYVDPQSPWAGSISSIGLKGTIGYIPPEYGGGGHASTYGDVYSFGIVLLEILTSKRPTDPMFTDGLDIISFVENSFPDQIFEVIDAYLVEECKNLSQENKVPENEIYQCLVDLLQVALSCTRLLPSERSNMKLVASKMHSIKTSQLGWEKK